jgi:hypothetical protein
LPIFEYKDEIKQHIINESYSTLDVILEYVNPFSVVTIYIVEFSSLVECEFMAEKL